ncbi:hypothetical protein [Bacillus changyiensis]|uniref:hypothetical protein n=1 Tax=Bacillus changyiensis TaxID=3004103 RepID=UPI0022E6C205|nr:hypothetical protein [Bacillus changyiensis]MDA1474952.1 hypothetical protein [Bacillus changyiensis]
MRAAGLYIVSGINLDLTVMMIVSLLIPFFISQLLKRKFPYLLLIVFAPIVIYIWWNSVDVVEAISNENGKYLVREKQPPFCCDKDLERQSTYVIYKKVSHCFYKKDIEFNSVPSLFMDRYGSEKPSVKQIEDYITKIQLPYSIPLKSDR